MRTTTPGWTNQRRLHSGHRLFFTDDPNRIAIADNSARVPEQTDDGTMWLDFSRPIVVAGKHCFAPITSEERNEFRTPIDFETALYLAERYDWKIKQHNFCYRVVNCEPA